MTSEQHYKADGIAEGISQRTRQLSDWEEYSRSGVVTPLKLRMAHGIIDFVPQQAFEDFKSACVASLKKEIEALKSEFAAL